MHASFVCSGLCAFVTSSLLLTGTLLAESSDRTKIESVFLSVPKTSTTQPIHMSSRAGAGQPIPTGEELQRQPGMMQAVLAVSNSWVDPLLIKSVPSASPVITVVGAEHRALRGLAGDDDRVWRIEYSRQTLFVADNAGDHGKPPAPIVRDVIVYLAPARLDLLRIELVNSEATGRSTPEPSAFSAMSQREKAGPEIWSVPDERLAKLSLLDALNAIDKRGMGTWRSAKTVIANYVNWSYGFDLSMRPREPVPAWSIDLRGTGSIPASAPVHPDAINHIRHIVDITGKWRIALSTPQPDPPEGEQRFTPPATPPPASAPDKSNPGVQP